MNRVSRSLRIILLNTALAVFALALEASAGDPNGCHQDRVFLVSTRHLSSNVCQADLQHPDLRIWKCDVGSSEQISLDQFEDGLEPDRPVMIYLHGNRMDPSSLMSRFCSIRNRINPCRVCEGVDWVIFSWPSSKVTTGVRDFRIKAERCDAHGLYLGWLARRQLSTSKHLAMMAYSFGARIATGALHAAAGGSLGGRTLPGEPLQGGAVPVGLIAPAIEDSWLSCNGYHRLATKNLDQLVLLYNDHDRVLKRYWLLEKMLSEKALGYTGPTSFARRFDGSRLPVRAREFSRWVKCRHSELDYYELRGGAAPEMARLINGLQESSNN